MLTKAFYSPEQVFLPSEKNPIVLDIINPIENENTINFEEKEWKNYLP
jgi:hypothetical protein